MRWKCLVATGLVSVGFFITSCGDQSPNSTPPPEVLTQESTPSPTQGSLSKEETLVAEWDQGKIFLTQIDRILGGRKTQILESQPDPAAGQTILAQERRKILDTLIDNYLLVQEARSRALSLTDVQKEKLLKDFRANFETEEEYRQSLKDAHQTEEGLVETLSTIQLARLCIEDQRKKIQLSLTPEHLQQYYDMHVADYFTAPARSDVNWVVIQENENRSLAEAEQVARKLYAEAREKVEQVDDLEKKRDVLQEMAYNYSDDFSGKYNYGFANLYHYGTLWDECTQAFRDELVKRKKSGELSDVVQIKKDAYGFFLLVVKHESFVSPFSSPNVQKMLPNMILKERLEEWRKQLQTKYHLKIFDERLKHMPAVQSVPVHSQ